MDGLDGNYARRFNLTSAFGEMYDHYSDQIFTVLLVLVFVAKYTLTVFVVVTVVIFWVLNCCYLAAEHAIKSNFDRNSKSSLFFIKHLSHPQLEFLAYKISVLQIFGPATMNLVCGTALASLLQHN